VDTLLNASDEILEISPTKPWKASVRVQLRPHRDYLRSPHFQKSGYLEQYGRTTNLNRTKAREGVAEFVTDQSDVRSWHLADVNAPRASFERLADAHRTPRNGSRAVRVRQCIEWNRKIVWAQWPVG
jgi:hypothetical protein